MAKKENGEKHGGKRGDLRDSVAIEAMRALIASRGFSATAEPAAATMLARTAYAIADAMLAERAHPAAGEG